MKINLHLVVSNILIGIAVFIFGYLLLSSGKFFDVGKAVETNRVKIEQAQNDITDIHKILNERTQLIVDINERTSKNLEKSSANYENILILLHGQENLLKEIRDVSLGNRKILESQEINRALMMEQARIIAANVVNTTSETAEVAKASTDKILAALARLEQLILKGQK